MPRRYEAFSMDFDDFDGGLDRFNAGFPDLIGDAVFATGALMIEDFIEEEPKAPHEHGALWGSQLIEFIDDPSGKIIGIRAGFNVDYAGILHDWKELPYKPIATWTEPGSGPGFISTKLAKNKKKYIDNVGKEIKEGWGRRR